MRRLARQYGSLDGGFTELLVRILHSLLRSILRFLFPRFFPPPTCDAKLSAMYDDLDDRAVLNLESPTFYWMCFGYWDPKSPPSTLRQACEAMSRQAAQRLHLKSVDSVLDVGSGCGDHALYLSDMFPSCRFHGIEITPHQLEIARVRASFDRSQTKHPVRFFLGSATDMIFKDAAFDKLYCIDSAYHFAPSRLQFFIEAARVLKPGGRMVLIDLCLAARYRSLAEVPPKQRAHVSRLAEAAAIPLENLCSHADYIEQLTELEFVEVTLEDISPFVFSGFSQWMLRHVWRHGSPHHPISWLKLLAIGWVTRSFASADAALSFVIVMANKRKPPVHVVHASDHDVAPQPPSDERRAALLGDNHDDDDDDSSMFPPNPPPECAFAIPTSTSPESSTSECSSSSSVPLPPSTKPAAKPPKLVSRLVKRVYKLEAQHPRPAEMSSSQSLSELSADARPASNPDDSSVSLEQDPSELLSAAASVPLNP